MAMRRLTFILFACFISIKSFPQADISMVTHWNNRANYNPASIVRPGYIYLFSNVRNQWKGFNGAPEVINFQTSGFSENLNSGFGLSVTADKIGLTQALNPSILYAYRMMDRYENSFSLGISAGVFSRSLNGTGYEPETIIDPSLIYEVKRTLLPDANFGFEFQNRYFVAGISTTHLFSLFTETTDYQISNHSYAYFIYRNTDSELMNYQLGLQCVNRSNLYVAEINAGLRFKNPTGLMRGAAELFDIGFTYRTTKQLSAFFGVMLSPDFRVGYAYDHSFIPGFQAHDTHEIMLEYRFPVKEFNCKTCPNNDYWYF
jgi:type IX secretion system PorP/SprF family membrane protein